MAEISYGFKIGDRWPLCKNCGHVHKIPFRKMEDGRWWTERGQGFEEFTCEKCNKSALTLVEVSYADHLGEVPAYTIRWAGNRYVMVKTTTQRITRDTPRMHVFFSEVGGRTKEEALYWAERAASKNGLPLIIPASFEGVDAKLPESKS